MPLSADVRVSGGVSFEEQRQLLDDLRCLGLDPAIRVVPTRRGLSDVPWLVLIAVPLQLFLTTLVQNLASDTYLRLKTCIDNVLHRQRQQESVAHVLVLQDEATGARVVLEPDLPPEGYQQLFGLDISAIKRGPLHYDRSRHQWRSELDE